MGRVAGFYFVTYKGKRGVAEYLAHIDQWAMIGSVGRYTDSDFSNIDEMRIEFREDKDTDGFKCPKCKSNNVQPLYNKSLEFTQFGCNACGYEFPSMNLNLQKI